MAVRQLARWLLCGVIASFCAHGETDQDRNRAAEPMTDLTVLHDISYEPGNRHQLDLYVSRASAPPRPVVVYIYGGAWADGSKADFAWIGAAFARLGFLAIIPDYRVYPEAHWPMFLEDNAAALRWARDHAAEFGGDPAKLVLMGHSAGANNVLSLAVDPRWLASVGLTQKDLSAVIGLSGPYNLSPLDSAREREIFGPKTGYADPIHFIRGGSPPLLLIIGGQDDAADPRDSDAVADKVRATGREAEVIHYPPLGHSDTQNALAFSPERPPHLLAAILRFLAQHGIRPQPS